MKGQKWAIIWSITLLQAEPEAARLLFPGTSIGGSVAVGRTVGVVGRTVAGECWHYFSVFFGCGFSKKKGMNLNFLGHVSTPRCVRTPVKECVPRTVETPRKVKIAKTFTFFPPPLKSDVHSFPSSDYRISKFDPICRSARLLWMCLRTPPSLSVARRSLPPRMYSLSLFE